MKRWHLAGALTGALILWLGARASAADVTQNPANTPPSSRAPAPGTAPSIAPSTVRGGGPGEQPTAAREPYHANILELTRTNNAFRRVVFTGARSQLVVMSIPPGQDVGPEMHPRVEQSLFFVSGRGEAFLNGQRQPIAAGDVLVVTPGTRHNVVNTGSEPLKLYTIYAPPNHLDGRVHQTRTDAEADTQDEAFGRAVP
jgi:mannose-6-phosphate isomerase-like protein (cupin superfamily)